MEKCINKNHSQKFLTVITCCTELFNGMISTKTVRIRRLFEIQLKAFQTSIPAVREFKTFLTCGLNITAGNIPTITYPRGKFKTFSVLVRTGTNTVQVATCTARYLIAGIILLGTLATFVYTMCSEAPCAINFFVDSCQHVLYPPVLKSLQLLLYHLYIRNANSI